MWGPTLLDFGAEVEQGWPPHHGAEAANRAGGSGSPHFLGQHTGLFRTQAATAVFGWPGRRRPAFFAECRLPVFPVARQLGAELTHWTEDGMFCRSLTFPASLEGS